VFSHCWLVWLFGTCCACSSHPVQMQKVKVKMSLCFNWAPRHEGVLAEWRYSSTHSLTSALDRGEWSASCPDCFTPRERAPGTHWIGGWVGPRAVLDTVVKRKIPSPHQELNPRTTIVQPVAQCYTDWAIMVPLFRCLSKINLATFTGDAAYAKHLKTYIIFCWSP
jgi:hypothetical protein